MELSLEEAMAHAEELTDAIRGGELEGPSSTAGLTDQVKQQLARRYLPRILEAFVGWVLEGFDVELELPWTLRPSIYCEACSLELLEAVGDDVGDWFDAREERPK
jgi:hypothetical protein